MSLYTASLNSGSNGNCYYIGNSTEAVLVDVGISCREVERRMNRLDLNIHKVKAIFISHEHSDHIKGVEVLSRKYKLPVYITPSTHRSSRLELNEDLIRPFIAEYSFEIGALKVIPFKKYHDAAEPHSFIVEGNGIKVGVFTDIGMICERVERYFKQCNAAFLETNYDEEMLENGHYPYQLKKRISGGKGHLSNGQALHLFNNHKSDFLSHIFLSHLSRENNSPHIAKELFLKHAGKTNVVIASRDYETDVYTITATRNLVMQVPVPKKQKQLTLF